MELENHLFVEENGNPTGHVPVLLLYLFQGVYCRCHPRSLRFGSSLKCRRPWTWWPHLAKPRPKKRLRLEKKSMFIHVQCVSSEFGFLVDVSSFFFGPTKTSTIIYIYYSAKVFTCERPWQRRHGSAGYKKRGTL